MFKGQWLDSLGNKAKDFDRFLLTKNGHGEVNRLTEWTFLYYFFYCIFQRFRDFFDIFLHFHDILLSF